MGGLERNRGRGPRCYKTAWNGFRAENDEENRIFKEMFERSLGGDTQTKQANDVKTRRYRSYTFTPLDITSGKHAKVQFFGSRSTIEAAKQTALPIFKHNGLQSSGECTL